MRKLLRFPRFPIPSMRRTRSPNPEPPPPLPGNPFPPTSVPPPTWTVDWWRARETSLCAVALAALLTTSAALAAVIPSARLYHFGYALYLVSSALHDELLLRALSIGASLLFLHGAVRASGAASFLGLGGGAWRELDLFSVGAQLTLLALSTRRAVAVALRRKPFRFSRREARLYGDHFARRGLPLADFHELIGGARWHRLAPGERRQLQREGEPAADLVLLATSAAPGGGAGGGAAVATRCDVIVEHLEPGALVGERGLSALGCATAADADAVRAAASSVSVIACGPLDYVTWEKGALVRHLAQHSGARACVMEMLAADEARKLKTAEAHMLGEDGRAGP